MTRAIKRWGSPNKLLLSGSLWLWLFAALTMPCRATSPLSMALDGNADSVVIAGLEAGAEIVFYSVSRFSSGFVPRTERRAERLLDEDGDGEIRVALGQPAPPKFLAVAVALRSGRYGVLTPPGSPARAAPPVSSLVDGTERQFDRLEERKPYVEYFLTRPGMGAWALATGDGTPADESPPGDGIVRTSVSDLLPVGTSPSPPEKYETGDLLVRVAPAEMEYFVVRIER